MSSSTDFGREVFITGLRNQHAVENQAVQLLQRQVDRLVNYPEMAERMKLHIQESQAQAQRIEEILSKLGESHSSLKDAAMSVMGNMAALAHAPAKDEVIKNSLANYAFEHFEVASYKSLLTVAEAIGQGGAKAPLEQSLKEEASMIQWLDEHLGPTTLRYIQLASAGHQAGV